MDPGTVPEPASARRVAGSKAPSQAGAAAVLYHLRTPGGTRPTRRLRSKDGQRARFVASLPSLGDRDVKAGRRSVGEPAVALGIEPEAHDGSGHRLRARAALYLANRLLTGVPRQVPSPSLGVERQLHDRAREQRRLAERSAAYREELAGVGAGPERSRPIDDHARDRALAREHEVRHRVR